MPRLPTLVRTTVVAIVAAFVLTGAGPAVAAPPRWVRDIDRTVNGHDVSVAIAVRGNWLYRHAAWKQRTPASNQKLLLSMALLHRTSLRTRVRTQVFAKGTTTSGVLRGDLWLVGHGDPEVDRATMTALARAVDASGIQRVRGRVMGATTGFVRDWWAPGWQDYFPRDYIALPTALTFGGNADARGVHIRDPERRAARSLTHRLRARGVPVTMDAGAGIPPTGLRRVVTRRSASFEVLLRHMNRRSRNFHAEVLGKWLGGLVRGGAGSIAKGARAIEAFADGRGVAVVANDSSGLSYGNRVRPQDLVALLRFAQQRPWGRAFRAGLATGDQGTLEDRLIGVKVRAKTGTLISISALSGWVWLEGEGTWGEFSIMSRGMSKSAAIAIEDRIVRIAANRASLGGVRPSAKAA
ncbi:MAG TPA: D-alanyl-D-alanine carboxypeptidase [Actinomycetota bacterium]|nr:D-alanyl-D-alanine carboxypeptidase [Actinomycetota bacterium]